MYRPWLPAPGEHLVVDWATEAGLELFCAVLAWSRYRFVRFAPDQTRATTLALLAEGFEELGGVPAVVLTDRMGCLKAGVVANAVVPHPEYVQFGAHSGFRPDVCEAADPESKGVVEALAGYAQRDRRDLVVPALADGGWPDLAAANAAARAWGAEVNGRPHRETAAVPAARLAAERGVLRPLPGLRPPRRRGVLRKVDRLGMVGLAAARYAVPDHLVGQQVEVVADEAAVVIHHAATGAEVARHAPVAPGEVALGTVAPAVATRRPVRGLRPRTASEVAFLGLGPPAAAFLRAAAAAGTTRLPGELAAIVALEPGWGRAALVAALQRATRFRRFRAADVRAILTAGPRAPEPARPGAGLGPLGLRAGPAGGAGARRSAPTPSPRRCPRARRWRPRPREGPGERPGPAPGARPGGRPAPAAPGHHAGPGPGAAADGQDPALGARGGAPGPGPGRGRRPRGGHPRRPAAGGGLPGGQDAGGVPGGAVLRPPGHLRLPGLPGVGAAARENLLLLGPAGTGKSHVLLGCAHRAVEQDLRVRYFAAADLVETLYRALADNSVGRALDALLRHDLVVVDELGFAPLDDTGSQLLFRFVAAAYERRSLGLASHWPFEQWGRFLPVPTTAASLLDRLLHHAVVVVTEGESFRMREARARTAGRGALM